MTLHEAVPTVLTGGKRVTMAAFGTPHAQRSTPKQILLHSHAPFAPHKALGRIMYRRESCFAHLFCLRWLARTGSALRAVGERELVHGCERQFDEAGVSFRGQRTPKTLLYFKTVDSLKDRNDHCFKQFPYQKFWGPPSWYFEAS